MASITACISAYNEEDNLPKLFESLKGIDDIVLYDHCSTDNTAKIAKEYGARVFTHPLPHAIVTKEDVYEFIAKYGFAPKYTEGEHIDQWLDDLNGMLKEAKNDWVFQVDCDEIVTWDLPYIESILPTCDAVGYTFIHERDENGKPTMMLPQNKLFNRTKFKWVSQVHAVLAGEKRNIHITDKMVLNHYQKPKHDSRSKYINRMEYAMIKDGDMRNTFYLAREYGYYKEYEKAIQFGLVYFSMNPVWRPEICEMWLIMAKCYWQLHKGEMARRACMEAIMRNPNFKEALAFMSQITWENDGKAWKRFSEQANNDDVLFVNNTI